MSHSHDESDDSDAVDLFQEPTDFYAPEKSATFTEYTLKDGRSISLRLVGHSPLWGHLLWNAAQVVTAYLEENASTYIHEKNILELGAGAGLPSLACAAYGAKNVAVTDYPDPDLLANLEYNIEHSGLSVSENTTLSAKGYLWGNPVTELQSCLGPGTDGFDVIIMADILFNHSEHGKLVDTLCNALSKSPDAVALVFFTPYRPWLLQKDLAFFDLARERGFVTSKILEHIMDKVMFDEDPGDELLRRTVFGYQVRRSPP